MKNVALTFCFIVFSLFVFGKTQPVNAQQCTCTMGQNRVPYVQTPCPTGYISACTGNPYQGNLGCSCTLEQPGTNCTTVGQVATTGKPCCSGLTPEPRSSVCVSTGVTPNTGGTTKLCNAISDSALKSQCETCYSRTGSWTWTAIGCIQTDLSGFFNTFLRLGVGIAGGIAFLLIILGGFQILTSAGNPEQLNAGKELVGSAITGLLLIIFSVFFLKIIGVDILGIPGWGSTSSLPGPR